MDIFQQVVQATQKISSTDHYPITVQKITKWVKQRISGHNVRQYQEQKISLYVIRQGQLYLTCLKRQLWGNLDKAQLFDFKKDAYRALQLIASRQSIPEYLLEAKNQDFIYQQVIEEFLKSGIEPEVTLAYVDVYGEHDPESLIDRLLFNLKDEHGFYPSTTLNSYENAKYGGWSAKLNDVNGGLNQFTQVKLLAPRVKLDIIKGKIESVKYETPPGSKTEPLIPYTSSREVELKLISRIIKRYKRQFKKNNLEQNPESYSNYYDFYCQVKPFLPVHVTEGFKKTLALMCKGYLAIGLTGIWNWTAGKNDLGQPILSGDTKALNPILKQYLKDTVEIILCFDSDSKLKTRIKVNQALSALQKSLKKQIKSLDKVERLTWDVSYGKGVDDVLANGHILEQVSVVSNPIKDWYESLNQLTGENIIFVNQRYLDIKIDPNTPIIAIKSKHGTGKTESATQVIEFNGHNYYSSLTNRILLAKEQSVRFSFGHIDGDKLEQHSGYSSCIDSDLKIDFEAIVASQKRLVILLDEFSQLLPYIASSNTDIKKGRATKIDRFRQMLIYAYFNGQIIILDADLSDKDLKALMRFLGIEQAEFDANSQIFVNEYQGDSCDIFVHPSKEKNYYLLAQKVVQGKRVFCSSTAQQNKSKYGTIQLEKKLKKLKKADGSRVKILRIDSETLLAKDSAINKLREMTATGNIAEAIALSDADVIIASPSIESGVSIPKSVHFDAVFAFSSGNIPVDNFIQGLFRVRCQCERHIYIPECGLKDNSSGWGLSYADKLDSLRQKYGALIDSFIYQGVRDDDGTIFGDDSNSIYTYLWAVYNSYIDIGKAAYRDCVISSLLSKGHQIFIDDEDIHQQDKLIMRVKAVQDVNEALVEEATDIEQAPEITEQKASELERSRSMYTSELNSLKRFKMYRKFGDDLSVAAILWELESGIYAKSRLRWAMANPAKIVFKELSKVKQQQTSYDKCNSSLMAMAQLLNLLGFKEFLEYILNNPYSKDDQQVQNILARWLPCRHQVKHVIGVFLNPDNPIRAINAVLKKLGYETDVCSRDEVTGVRSYQLIPEDDEREAIRLALLKRFDSESN